MQLTCDLGIQIRHNEQDNVDNFPTDKRVVSIENVPNGIGIWPFVYCSLKLSNVVGVTGLIVIYTNPLQIHIQKTV